MCLLWKTSQKQKIKASWQIQSDEVEFKRRASNKGKGIKKVNIKGDSFLNWAAVNREKKHIERLEHICQVVLASGIDP